MAITDVLGGAASGLGTILGGIAGSSASSGDMAAAQQAATEGYRKLLDLGYAPDTAKAIVLQQFQQTGKLTPQMIQAVNLGVSQASQVQTDPALQQAQMQALQSLQQQGKGGMNMQEQANLAQIQNQLGNQEKAQQASIMQNMAQRGLGGGGAELAARLSAQQGGANQASQAGLQMAGQAQQNALQALMQGGQLGGQMQAQQFGQNMQKANAADQFSRFNVQNQQAVQAANVAAANQAQGANLANQQQISNANTMAANQELQRQRQAQLQDYQASVGYGTAAANAGQKQADQMRAIGDSAAKGANNLGAGIGEAVGDVITAL